MIGQSGLIKTVLRQIQSDVFPRFSIFVGSTGSEKNEMAKVVAEALGAHCVNSTDCKVDTIRDIITASYKVTALTVYNITDADTMSLQARNALLKVTEEPPNKAYFVMTLSDINNTLPTIKSRGAVYVLEPYTRAELEQYCFKFSYSEEQLDIVLQLCDTPGQIELLHSYGPKAFFEYVQKVVDNIAVASGSNSFKIAQSIKLNVKTENDGYDLELFWKAFCAVCLQRGAYKGLLLTSSYLSRISNKSINKAMLFDQWILDIRKEWLDGSK